MVDIILSLELSLHEIAALAQPLLGGLVSCLHSLKYCSEPVHVTFQRNTGTFSAFVGPSITNESE